MATLETVRAIAVDVDGTIANGVHDVSPRTLAALGEAERRGYAVILLTGRARRSALRIAIDAGLTSPVVSCNGSIVTDPASGTDRQVATLGDADVRAMVALADRFDLTLTWWTAQDVYVSRSGPGQRLIESLNAQVAVVADTAAIPRGKVVKSMLYGTGSELDAVAGELLDRIPRLTRSMDEFYELSAIGANKWETLSRVLAELGIGAEECLGIGDGGNDVPWLAEIGYPVAMANARQEVKEVAVRTIGHHAEDGAAQFLESLISDRPG